MTDAPKRRTRLSKGRVRMVAWVAGGATFVTGVGVLGAAPKPEASDAAPSTGTARRPVVIVRTVLRRVIVTAPTASAPVEVVAAPSRSEGSSSSTGGAAAPAPITTSTGGS